MMTKYQVYITWMDNKGEEIDCTDFQLRDNLVAFAKISSTEHRLIPLNNIRDIRVVSLK